jgi:PAS domain S-box-containing protein
MSDETHDLLRLARENYGWIGVSITFVSLMFKPFRNVLAWFFGWILKPVVVIERLTLAVDKLAGRVESVDARLQGVDSRLLGLEHVIANACAAADAANTRARMAFEDSAIGFFECDMRGDCVWVNTALAKLFGMSRESMMGRGWLAALHSDDMHKTHEEWEETIKAWRPYKTRYRVVNGREPVTVEASATVLKTSANTPICIWGRVVPLPTMVA